MNVRALDLSRGQLAGKLAPLPPDGPASYLRSNAFILSSTTRIIANR